jgi:PAS domain S-box-containing protein
MFRAFTPIKTWYVRLRDGHLHSVLLVIGSMLILTFIITAALTIWDSRERDLDAGEHELSHLSLTLSETTARTMQNLDLILRVLQTRIAEAGIKTPDDLREKFATEAAHRLLLDRIQDAGRIDALSVIDNVGHVVNYTRNWPAPRDLDLTDRDYFIAHRDMPKLGLFVAAPVRNRTTGEWTTFLTRRLSGPNGEFLGVILAVVRIQYFVDFYQAVLPGNAATISLFRRDGVLLARYPDFETFGGRSFGQQPLFTRMLRHADAGVIHTPASAFDGIARIMTPRVVPGFPLIINVTNTRDAVLAGWRLRTIYTAILTGAAVCLVMLSGMLLSRQVDGRVRMTRLQAEQEQANRTAAQIRDLNATLDSNLQQLRAITDNLPMVISYVDADRRIRFVNRTGERWFGRPASEILGRTPSELLGRRARLGTSKLLAELSQGPVRYERNVRHTDGSLRIIDVLNVPDRAPDGKVRGYYSLRADITDRKATEEQLRQSQKLEAVGKLTGGVSHDFNNLLQIILGNAELLSEELADNPRLRALAEMSRSAAERGAELTHRLLAFGRRQTLEPKAVNASDLIAGMEGLLKRTLREDIDIVFVRGDGLWPALVDSSQLENALLNLCINARDAILGSGRVTIETANVEFDQAYCSQYTDVTPGPYVMIAVSDTGIGIPPENLDRVFEPFFTSKEVGKGTGLGLSMVYGFVRQSQGHVQIHSELGRGTTVRLYLPKAQEMVEPVVETSAARSDLHGSETILVVEDDDMVRAHVEGQLAGLGYRVVSASNGLEALKIMRSRADIDLLFTDVIMPGGMNGRELVEAARKLWPRLAILYTSGYMDSVIPHQDRLDMEIPVLSKPYRSVDLAQKLRVVLATRVG